LTRRGLACERLGFDWPEAGRLCSRQSPAPPQEEWLASSPSPCDKTKVRSTSSHARARIKGPDAVTVEFENDSG
jgi:hypothetical protein